MKLSTKGRYGTRAMIELALHHNKGIVQLQEIAEKEGISSRYLEHLIGALKVAGLVRSYRGPQGGYVLSREPSEIRLSEILRALEGTMALVECADDFRVCPRSSVCAARDIWLEAKEALTNLLESYTLRDLAERQREKE